MRFVEIFNTFCFERNCRETVLEKVDLNRDFFGNKHCKRRFSRKNVFLQPCDYVILLVFSKISSRKFKKDSL